MRVFIAFAIDDSIRQRIQHFMNVVREFAPDARWVRAESLHVTLKFIGQQPKKMVDEIQQLLADVKSVPIQLSFQGWGFFPAPKSARVFWIGVESGPELVQLATIVDCKTAQLGFPQEDQFTPHLTLARAGRSGAPRRQREDARNRTFKRLQDQLALLPQPEFGTMTAREFFLFDSKLSPGGAEYSKIERYELR
ncbi:MAG: RNA 2',3'-cyclic phosphodiesterase [Acidobacteria bacterium]|nr:RNA 2',3'-cyclic phosphodiesterase [Acidobacteriota bacterium]